MIKKPNIIFKTYGGDDVLACNLALIFEFKTQSLKHHAFGPRHGYVYQNNDFKCGNGDALPKVNVYKTKTQLVFESLSEPPAYGLPRLYRVK